MSLLRNASTRSLRWLAGLALVALAGCATTDPEAIRRTGFQPEEDEQELWSSSAEIDSVLRERGVLHDDPALQQYLDGVLARIAPEVAGSTRVAVLRDPYLNAFALPNGSIYVHSGMLASVENEAQLATLLGHEVTHYTERHSLARQRLAENRTLAIQVVVGILAVAVAASGDANAVRAMLELGGRVTPSLVETQVSGYSRDLELEADAGGFALMTAAGYDPREAARIFELLEADAIEAGGEEPFFYGSHPQLSERRESYRALLLAQPGNPSPAPDPLDQAAFAAAVAGLQLDAARADVAMGRAARARRTLDRHLAFRPDSAPAYFLMGEAYRRDDADDRARAAYERAAALDAAYALPHRELGLLRRAAGEQTAARLAFERYLALAPTAADRPIIEAYMTDSGVGP